MSKSSGFLSPAALAVAAITTYKIFNDKEKRRKLIKLFTTRAFIVNLFVIIGFCYYGLNIEDNNEDSKRLKESIKSGILGMIIALMAFVDLTLAPFWILFVAAYYLQIG